MLYAGLEEGLKEGETGERGYLPHLGLKVVFTSGYTGNAIVHHGRSDEGVTLLSKPHYAGQLAQIVSEARQAGPARREEGDHDDLDEIETVLLADDNRLARGSLVMMLEDLGFGVIEAETAQEALAAATSGERFEAALVDFHLPDMDGVELAGKLRGIRPNLRLAIISGQPVGPGALAEIPGPPVSMLLKPFNARQLEELLYASPLN